MIRAIIVVLGALVVASPLEAQRDVERYGFNAGIGPAVTRLALDSAPSRARRGFSARFGVRVCALCWMDVRALTLWGGLNLSATDVRGITREEHPYSFSRTDLGMQVALRTGYLRPYVALWLANKHTALVDRDSLNYFAERAPRTSSVGVEIPITPGGRGIDISLTRLNGVFTKTEYRDSVSVGPRLGYSGFALTLGWSGPFTGTSLPWR